MVSPAASRVRFAGELEGRHWTLQNTRSEPDLPPELTAATERCNLEGTSAVLGPVSPSAKEGGAATCICSFKTSARAQMPPPFLYAKLKFYSYSFSHYSAPHMNDKHDKNVGLQ